MAEKLRRQKNIHHLVDTSDLFEVSIPSINCISVLCLRSVVRGMMQFSAAQPTPRLTYLVDFSAKSTAIGRQQHTWALLEDANYAQCLARARTFTTLEDAEAARDAGLIKGGSPVNALIADGENWFNAPLRYENEPARHKLLDLVRVLPRPAPRQLGLFAAQPLPSLRQLTKSQSFPVWA